MATIPNKYALYNAESTKNVTVVVVIDGVPPIASQIPNKMIRYGDPDIHYGDPGLVYGGTVPVSGVLDILDLNTSSVQIQQTIEPEQGRGSVTQLTLGFIDKNGYMSKVVSPGVIIPDIIGTEVNVYLGYTELSYPEDYYRIYRGYVTGVSTQAGLILLSVSDPNVKRRQDIFIDSNASGKLSLACNNSQTTLDMTSTGNLYQQILGPNGLHDPSVTTYIKIDDEIMSYSASGIISDTQIVVTRGARGTTPAAHDAGSTVEATIQLEGNCMDLALKIMLSGWNGPWISNQPIQALGTENIGPSGLIPNVLLLPQYVDAVNAYGLTIGDYVTITGSGAGNNGTWTILDFATVNGVSNNAILLSGATFTQEFPTSAVMALRSQYDTLPVDCGPAMTPKDVDVPRHVYVRDTFLNGVQNSFRFYISATENAKTFIETNIYLASGTYAVTRNGRCSVSINQPPIADQPLNILTADNITNPDQIKQTRATNNRKFWNDILFNYDYDDAGNPTNVLENFDAQSFQEIGIRQQLPIDALGGRSDLGASTMFQRRSDLMLSRFSRGAAQIDLKVNWGIGNSIEAGDIVAIKDNGELQVTNFSTGTRNLGFQLYEVVNRTLDIKSANTSLTLISGIAAQATDHYGVIAPSSHVGAGSTTTQIQIVDSYGYFDPGDEIAKWTTYVGDHLLIHDANFTVSYPTVLVDYDRLNGKYLVVSPALPAPPPQGYIVDFDYYSTNPAQDIESKLIHCFFAHDATIISGIDHFNFTVSAGDLSACFVGAPVIVHNTNFSVESVETTITAIVGTQITVAADLGFTPSAGMIASLLGMPDGAQPYRWI